MPTSSEGESRPRKGFFRHLLEALHRSRRRNALRVLRRYRHLNAGEAQIRPASHVPQSRQNEKSSRNAHGNDALVSAIRQVRQNAGNKFA